MSLVFRFPTYHPSSYNNQAPRGYDFFQDLWREVALTNAYEQQVGNDYCPQTHQGSVKLASLLLGHYKPKEISVEVDSENVTLHGLHRIDREDGFEKSEFKRFIKLPQCVRFQPEEIKLQMRGNELTITGRHVTEGLRSRDYSRRILLPKDADLSSVTSRLSKEGLLTIEASRDPALWQHKRSVEVTMETDEAGEEPKQTKSADAEETGN
ncbi:hypothetical protein ACROYT_G043777 [Oculina patagonica]